MAKHYDGDDGEGVEWGHPEDVDFWYPWPVGFGEPPDPEPIEITAEEKAALMAAHLDEIPF